MPSLFPSQETIDSRGSGSRPLEPNDLTSIYAYGYSNLSARTCRYPSPALTHPSLVLSLGRHLMDYIRIFYSKRSLSVRRHPQS